jgi:hypothetical protein
LATQPRTELSPPVSAGVPAPTGGQTRSTRKRRTGTRVLASIVGRASAVLTTSNPVAISARGSDRPKCDSQHGPTTPTRNSLQGSFPLPCPGLFAKGLPPDASRVNPTRELFPTLWLAPARLLDQSTRWPPASSLTRMARIVETRNGVSCSQECGYRLTCHMKVDAIRGYSPRKRGDGSAETTSLLSSFIPHPFCLRVPSLRASPRSGSDPSSPFPSWGPRRGIGHDFGRQWPARPPR